MNLKNINPIKSVAFFVVIGLLTACNSVTLKKADDAMLIKQYAIAADMYDQLASNSSLTKEEGQNAAFRGAECYRFNHQPKKALKLYAKSLSYGAKDPQVLFRLGQTQKELGEYQQAIESFKKYQKEAPVTNAPKP